jgi:hypothetical protein
MFWQLMSQPLKWSHNLHRTISATCKKEISISVSVYIKIIQKYGCKSVASTAATRRAAMEVTQTSSQVWMCVNLTSLNYFTYFFNV